MKARGILAVLLAAIFVVAPGCSLFTTSRQSVSIRASHPQADIFVDGNLVGQGTAVAELKRNRSHTITAQVGDRVGMAIIDKSVSMTGILDIVGGFLFLIPFIGLAGPGFYELDQTAVTVNIPPARHP